MIHQPPPKPMVVTCVQSPVLSGIPDTHIWDCSTIIKGKRVKVLVLFQESDVMETAPPVPPLEGGTGSSWVGKPLRDMRVCPDGRFLVTSDDENGNPLLRCAKLAPYPKDAK